MRISDWSSDVCSSDLFGQHLDLGIEEIVGRVAFLYVVDQQLGAVMLDIGLVQRIVLYPAAKGGVENLLLDQRVDLEFQADLPRQSLLARRRSGLFELFEQILHLAMVGFQKGDRVGELRIGHGLPPDRKSTRLNSSH